MKKVPSTVYDKKYYLDVCLGSEEFKKGQKLNNEVRKLLSQIKVRKNDRILDLGCGRGDITLSFSKKAKEVIGIDYSQAGIKLALKNKQKLRTVKGNVKFYRMSAEKLDFPDNYFDKIIAIDILEHLNKKEIKNVFREVKRVLRPNGILFIHTGTNKILYDLTYKYYIRPINLLIHFIDAVFFNKKYSALPKDPRQEIEKIQHVNEPTYYYLRSLFDEFNFIGDINTKTGYLKSGSGIKAKTYNFIVALDPLSKYFPLNILFAWAFVASLSNKKD